MIREEIKNAKFCILVYETRDESKREQMAIILRFVDKNGFIRERFFHIMHVKDTMALTLKNEICLFFSRYDLQIKIFEVRDIIEEVICVVNGMYYKLYFLKIILMHIMCIGS